MQGESVRTGASRVARPVASPIKTRSNDYARQLRSERLIHGDHVAERGIQGSPGSDELLHS